MGPKLWATERFRPHEAYVEARVLELMERFRVRQSIDYGVIADEATGTIVDGHHRFEAARRMGLRRVPVHTVDYRSPDIEVANWRTEEPPVTKDEVIARARSGDLFPPKTTRHDFVHTFDPVDVALDALT